MRWKSWRSGSKIILKSCHKYKINCFWFVRKIIRQCKYRYSSSRKFECWFETTNLENSRRAEKNGLTRRAIYFGYVKSKSFKECFPLSREAQHTRFGPKPRKRITIQNETRHVKKLNRESGYSIAVTSTSTPEFQDIGKCALYDNRVAILKTKRAQIERRVAPAVGGFIIRWRPWSWRSNASLFGKWWYVYTELHWKTAQRLCGKTKEL